MTVSPNEIIQVASFRPRLGDVTAFLYFHLAEQPPEAEMVLVKESDDDPGAWVETAESQARFDEWARASEEPPITQERCRSFLEGLGALLETLEGMDELTPESAQYEFYEAAKATFGDDKKTIREFFRYIYLLLTQTPSGPRLGEMLCVMSFGVFKETLERSLHRPFI